MKNGQIYTPEERAYKRNGRYWFVHWTSDACWLDIHIPAVEITELDWLELKQAIQPHE